MRVAGSRCSRRAIDPARRRKQIAGAAAGLRRRRVFRAALLLSAIAAVGLGLVIAGTRGSTRWVDPARAHVRAGWGGECGLAARPDRKERRGICRPPNGGYYCYYARTSDVRAWSENPIRFDRDCRRAKAALIEAGIIRA